MYVHVMYTLTTDNRKVYYLSCGLWGMKTLKFYMYTSTADMILYIHVNAYCCTHSNPLILVIQPGVFKNQK